MMDEAMQAKYDEKVKSIMALAKKKKNVLTKNTAAQCAAVVTCREPFANLSSNRVHIPMGCV